MISSKTEEYICVICKKEFNRIIKGKRISHHSIFKNKARQSKCITCSKGCAMKNRRNKSKDRNKCVCGNSKLASSKICNKCRYSSSTSNKNKEDKE